MNKQELKAIASQLRKPTGPEAAAVVERMNENNRKVSLKAIGLLDLRSGDRLLEIGPANGAYVTDIMKTEGVDYYGIDYSEDMVWEANKVNAKYIDLGKARFYHGSSDNMPFEDACFEKVLAVNTLYFWDDPLNHFREIKRVLKPGGQVNVGFGSKNFMEKLPFTEFGFNLYSPDEVREIIVASGFELEDLVPMEPEVIDIMGEEVRKEFYVAVCRK